MGWSYRGFEDDAAFPLLTTLERTASRQAAHGGEITRSQLLRRALSQKTTILGAFFILYASLFQMKMRWLRLTTV